VLGRVRLSRKVQLPPALGHGAGSLVSLTRPAGPAGDDPDLIEVAE
jgi:hypothetical protein